MKDMNKRDKVIDLIKALYDGKKLRHTTGEYITLGEPFGKWGACIWCGGGHHIPWRNQLGTHKLSSELLAQPQLFKAEKDTPIESEHACSHCGSHELIPVIWGLVEANTGSPSSPCEENIKILEQEDREEVHLGGCVSDSFMIDRKDPTHWCRSCHEYNLVGGT